MRNFILDRQAMGKKEERFHNWFSVRKPAEIHLGLSEIGNNDFNILLDEDDKEVMTIYLMTLNNVISSHDYFKSSRTLTLTEKIHLEMAWITDHNLYLIALYRPDNKYKLLTINKSTMTLERSQPLPNFSFINLEILLIDSLPFVGAYPITPTKIIRHCQTDPLTCITHLANDSSIHRLRWDSGESTYYFLDSHRHYLEKRSLNGETLWRIKLGGQGRKVFASGDHGYCVVTFSWHRVKSEADIFDAKSGNLLKSIAILGMQIRQVVLGHNKIFFLNGDSSVTLCNLASDFIVSKCSFHSKELSHIILSPDEDFLLATGMYFIVYCVS